MYGARIERMYIFFPGIAELQFYFLATLVAKLWNWSRLIIPPGWSWNINPHQHPGQGLSWGYSTNVAEPWHTRKIFSWQFHGRGQSAGILLRWENHHHWCQTCGKLSLFVGVSPVILSAQVVVTRLCQHWSNKVVLYWPEDNEVDMSVASAQYILLCFIYWPSESNISCFTITNVMLFHANKMV